jgi:hypothetical protein
MLAVVRLVFFLHRLFNFLGWKSYVLRVWTISTSFVSVDTIVVFVIALCGEVQHRLVGVVYHRGFVVCPRRLFLAVEVSKVVLLASVTNSSSPRATALVVRRNSSVLRSLCVPSLRFVLPAVVRVGFQEFWHLSSYVVAPPGPFPPYSPPCAV